MTSIKVTFLGIGLMGLPMARRLLAAGYQTLCWNRSQGKLSALAEEGAGVASSPEQAVREADIIISMLADGAVVGEVMGLAQAGLRAGACWIDMSSTRQDQALAFAAQLAAKGVGFVDAPVSGGVIGAQAGSLAIMAGASEYDYARVQPLLSVLGRTTHVGPVGCGQLAKLCNQLIVGATLQVVAEALLLAQAGGADPAAVRAALRGGFAESRILEVHGQRMLERNFTPGGQIKTHTKDMENIMAAAQQAGLNLPLAQEVTAQFQALRQWCPDADQAAVLLGLERANSGFRLGSGANIGPNIGPNPGSNHGPNPVVG
jgi:3-hydroxyisobutyrate dehydrogenase-like beta-hydroxyacid dehydrogenase